LQYDLILFIFDIVANILCYLKYKVGRHCKKSYM